MADFDHIIVGAGAAGCALAARLAKVLPHQSVLLLDAGGNNTDKTQQTFGERHWTLVVSGYNWGYKTVPQQGLDNRNIDYSRGKGLGGSTAINFCVYTRGSSADYDYWVELIEIFGQPGHGFKDFVGGSPITHGTQESVSVEVTKVWIFRFGEFIRNAYQYYFKNLDHNSDDPLDVSVYQLGIHEGKRVTTSKTYLASSLSNLTITTEASVTKILFQRKKTVGVEMDGKPSSSIFSTY